MTLIGYGHRILPQLLNWTRECVDVCQYLEVFGNHEQRAISLFQGSILFRNARETHCCLIAILEKLNTESIEVSSLFSNGEF